ncbi:EF-P lysine aminoacylase EpmA [Magnetospirillum sulfuroxidans]|uniref:EF-P lysine aminoacylase GenX n=1 Tax=Magnetospirillum sulfuroxidans TaxID=611300 RepID=A0ABS5IGF5_9PROT|nr:EF-P lysine aminoacylase EpmA [Magnetospirillum sulfuroxidans]MBR9973490.1 EF-P lysine aminoacylase GenX [Magnetospirillum sulfuroxidans]
MSTGKESWHPQALAERAPFLRQRGLILREVRAFFDRVDFTEVETPCLQISPGLEPHLKAFATALQDPWGEPDQTLYLHTSPEFAMKKLLVAGMERIFQIAHVFRNGERSDTHSPEFSMLEWYRAGGAINQMMDDTEELVRACTRAAGKQTLRRANHLCDPFAPWERLSIAQAFDRHCGIDVLATAPDPWAPDTARLAAEATRIGVSVSPTDRWDDIFFKILLDRIEPHLGMATPTILHSYPLSMAALARPNPADNRVADRFEAYACGVELCNAFGELTDAGEQERRFIADMDMKEALYGERYPLDRDFLAALAHGMPEAAGNALGLDRLVMLICGADSLEQVLWLPVQKTG